MPLISFAKKTSKWKESYVQTATPCRRTKCPSVRYIGGFAGEGSGCSPNNCYRKASIYSLSGQERGKREKERERERKREREGRKDRYMYTYREPTVKSFQRRIYSRLSALMCLIGRVPESLHSALHTHAMRFFCERIFRSREGRGKKCRERQRSDGREGAIASALFCPAGLLHLL